MENISNLTQLYFFSNSHSWNIIQCDITGGTEEVDFYINTVEESNELYKHLISEIMLKKYESFEINEETVPYNAPEAQREVRLTYLSIGFSSNEMNSEFFINFITKYFKDMGLYAPEYNFFLFFLPGMPAIATDEGIVEVPIGGFYSIRNKRIELNIHPMFTPIQFYKFTIHEMLHFIFQNDKQLIQSESLMDVFLEHFLEISEEEYKLYEEKIINNIYGFIKNKISVFEQYNSYLTENFYELFNECKDVLEKSNKCLELIINGNVLLKPRDPNKSWDNWKIRNRNLYKK